MTIRPIVRYPDSRLALRAQPVTIFDGALRELAEESGIAIATVIGDLASSADIVSSQVWHFMQVQSGTLPARWTFETAEMAVTALPSSGGDLPPNRTSSGTTVSIVPSIIFALPWVEPGQLHGA